jgi:hypothetical protein
VRTNSESILTVTVPEDYPDELIKRVAISSSIYPDPNTHIETVTYGYDGDRAGPRAAHPDVHPDRQQDRAMVCQAHRRDRAELGHRGAVQHPHHRAHPRRGRDRARPHASQRSFQGDNAPMRGLIETVLDLPDR